MAGVDASLLAHLFRRAGFASRPAELAFYQRLSYEKAVDDLLSGLPIAGESPSTREALDPVFMPATNLRGRVVVPDIGEIRQTWLERMVTASAPLVERMTLFLHDHFATAHRPPLIDTPELQAQNDLFRKNALGNWRTICHGIIEDVAMSVWLSNYLNVKKHPNENLARELFELFTLGANVFTETDVREAARALTGYTMIYNLTLTGSRNAMAFKIERHDTGVKTILGQSGNFMPHDVVDIALAHPEAPRFLARKLIETFVTPNAPASLIDSIAATLIGYNWELRPALKAIFLSPEFTSASRRSLVKTPAEFVAGGLRALGRTSGDDLTAGLKWMAKAGQSLYDPPNVGGWPTNMGWLGGGGVLARYNAATALADRHVAAFALPGRALRATTPDGWAKIFGITDTELAPSTRSALDDYLLASPNATDQVRDAAMITLLVASPDFSLA